MSKLKCAVIGAGYLGRFHAQKYSILENVNLVGVCDVDKPTSEKVAKELNIPAYTNYHELLNAVDAVSIAATTSAHYEIAKHCLKKGIHCLIEKPITRTKQEADELISIAKNNSAKLQVGHLERFNPAYQALDQYLDKPIYIDAQRLAPFNPRGSDVNVILDLMIHDIDIIQNIVKSPIIKIDAQGTSVLSAEIDIANARITFANNCIANLTASRISFKTQRQTNIFQNNSYFSIDYHNKKFAVSTKNPSVSHNETTFDKSDALLQEIISFVNAIQNDTNPVVTGEDGANALHTATLITKQVNANLHSMREYES